MKRRAFLWNAGLCTTALGAASWAAPLLAAQQLPRRRIPGGDDSLPVIGMGNSNAFRGGDRAASADLIRLFHEHGGAYVDCSGDSRFVVAEAAASLGIGGELFLGSYFADADDATLRSEAQRLLAVTGKERLDLMHAYPEYAVPNWRQFEQWKDEGLTRYIGVARHQSDYYESMIELMETGTVDFLQVNYSPLETEADRRVLPTALERGVAVTINRPFINGDYFARVRGQPLPDWAVLPEVHSLPPGRVLRADRDGQPRAPARQHRRRLRPPARPAHAQTHGRTPAGPLTPSPGLIVRALSSTRTPAERRSRRAPPTRNRPANNLSATVCPPDANGQALAKTAAATIAPASRPRVALSSGIRGRNDESLPETV
jgi:diketogulonate reductase-like aldo/keto reductase